MKPDDPKAVGRAALPAKTGRSGKEARFPRPLARFVLEKEDCLERALRVRAFEEEGPQESVTEVMAGYRAAVSSGITNPVFYRRYHAIWAEITGLADAQRMAREYKPEDYRTMGSISDSQRSIAERSRGKTRDEKLEEIGGWLQSRGYKDPAKKDSLLREAMQVFKCGETDVRDAARKAGLTRPYRKTTK